MATVYLATDLRLERRIALKIMHSHLSEDSVYQGRFIQEARAAARLANPHVVNVFDQGQDGDLAYLVMEYLPGITLRELLREQRRLDLQTTITIMDAVLSGLSAAHRAGIVHRDVKPENVLLAEDGRIKIGDFGLARATSANTATGQQLMGTIAYLAPELVTRGTADARSDIYALGIMLYEMLTGEQPYRGEQPMQIAFQHATESVPRPSAKNPAIPEQIDELVLWATERDPAERPHDAPEMLTRLRQIEEELGVAPLATPAAALSSAAESITNESFSGGLTKIFPTKEQPEPLLPATQLDHADRLRRKLAARKRRGALLLTLTLVLTGAAGVGGWWFGSGPGSRVSVPEVQGATKDEAIDALRSRELVPKVRESYDLDVAAGRVVESDPTAGSSLERGATVEVVVSNGPSPVSIESLAGSSVAKAEGVLSSHKIEISARKTRFADADPDTVVKVSITPRGKKDTIDCSTGCDAHQGDSAALVLSAGRFPELAGKTLDEAKKALEGAELVYDTKSPREFTSDAAKDVVLSVNKRTPDGPWEPGDTVTLVVSAGSMPATVNTTVADAEKALTEAGIKVSDDRPEIFSDSVPKGRVAGIKDYQGRSPWRVGDTATLLISKGPELFSVPNVVGKTRDEAIKILQDAGFSPTYHFLFKPFGSAPVTSQRPEAESKMPRNSEIYLTLSIVG